jgi:hypothetical protein
MAEPKKWRLQMIPASKKDALMAFVHGSTATARAVECNLMTVDSLLDDLLIEEYEGMHQILLSLGVINAGQLADVLFRELGLPDEVSHEHASKYLAGFEYDSGHSKLEASTCAGQLVTPLARLIRASRIVNTMANACWMLSDLRMSTLLGMKLLLRPSDG